MQIHNGFVAVMCGYVVECLFNIVLPCCFCCHAFLVFYLILTRRVNSVGWPSVWLYCCRMVVCLHLVLACTANLVTTQTSVRLCHAKCLS